jgi:hypothetical protein
MLKAACGLLRDSGRILVEVAPEGVELAALSAHVVIDDSSSSPPTHPGSWTRRRDVWALTSTSSTRRSNSNPPPTQAMSNPPTRERDFDRTVGFVTGTAPDGDDVLAGESSAQ